MKDITTELSNKELVRLGQAMERKGFSSLDEYLHWAVSRQTAEALKDK